MKFRIEEIDKSQSDVYFNSKTTPLTYRVAITIEVGIRVGNPTNEDEIVLTREYFYVGYNDGESVDNFYFDTDVRWTKIIGVKRGTFLTRNFNHEYLKQKEEELIQLFYDRLIKSEKDYIKKRKEVTQEIDEKIQNYQKYQKCDLFLKIQRKEKLKKIENEI